MHCDPGQHLRQSHCTSDCQWSHARCSTGCTVSDVVSGGQFTAVEVCYQAHSTSTL